MLLTPVVRAIVGSRAALASPTRLKAAAMRRSAATTSGRRSRSSDGSPAGIASGCPGSCDADVRRGGGIPPDEDLQRPERLLARQLELTERVAVSADVGLRHLDVLIVGDTHARPRLGDPDQILAASDGLPRELHLESCLGGQEPAACDDRCDRLARVLEIGQRRGGVGRSCGAAVPDAAPEVELPAQGDRASLNTRAVSRHLGAAAREKVDRWIELRTRLPGVEYRLLDACRADAKVGVVGDRLGDGGVQLLVVERDEPVVARPSLRRRPSPSIAQAVPSPEMLLP